MDACSQRPRWGNLINDSLRVLVGYAVEKVGGWTRSSTDLCFSEDHRQSERPVSWVGVGGGGGDSDEVGWSWWLFWRKCIPGIKMEP